MRRSRERIVFDVLMELRNARDGLSVTGINVKANMCTQRSHKILRCFIAHNIVEVAPRPTSYRNRVNIYRLTDKGYNLVLRVEELRSITAEFAEAQK